MILNFIFSNLNAILLAVQIIFLIIVAIRFFRPHFVKKISFKHLILAAVAFNLFFGIFVTWGQYYVWAHGRDFTRVFINQPLGSDVPLPFALGWTRTFFAHHLGYFAFYVLGRFWLNIFLVFIISAVLYSIFRLWQSRRGNFVEQGPELLLVLMLVCGYPNVLILIPLGFILSILMFGFSNIKGGGLVKIEPVFIFAAFSTILFSRIILSVLQ